MTAATADASAWLRDEIAAGRLSPAPDEATVAAVAGILLSGGGGERASRKKNRRGLDSAAVLEEVRHVPATSA